MPRDARGTFTLAMQKFCECQFFNAVSRMRRAAALDGTRRAGVKRAAVGGKLDRYWPSDAHELPWAASR